jgi:RNA polymerase subunit RPABC4/transcription elongation factor Spt4
MRLYSETEEGAPMKCPKCVPDHRLVLLAGRWTCLNCGYEKPGTYCPKCGSEMLRDEWQAIPGGLICIHAHCSNPQCGHESKLEVEKP